VEAATSPRRRLFHLELMERGYYIAQRGMINLSVPMQESDLAGFLQATRDYLIRHADVL
jgi:glutamate-1-semialdehyde 2,1-aminomutase